MSKTEKERRSKSPQAQCFSSCLAAASVTLVFTLCLSAQQMVQSTIRGTATDPSGAVVPNVTITLINLGTGVTTSGHTDQNGDYEIPGLLRGTYRLTATATGFSTFVADDVVLDSSQTRRIDVHMVVGAVQATVTVTAGAAVIHTEGGEITNSYAYQRYDNIPLVASRFDPTESLTGMAGVVTPTSGSDQLEFNG